MQGREAGHRIILVPFIYVMGIFKNNYGGANRRDADLQQSIPSVNGNDSFFEICFEGWDYRSFGEITDDFLQDKCSACDDYTRTSCVETMDFCRREKAKCLHQHETEEVRKFQVEHGKRMSDEHRIGIISKLDKI